jgi:DNA-binding transcriptional regulator YdaS (Cro superfamily)
MNRNALSAWLKANKISQAKFGEKLSPPVSQGLVSQWCRGDTRVTLEYSLQINQLTGSEVTPAHCAEMYLGTEARPKLRRLVPAKKAPRKRPRATSAPAKIAA